MNLLDQLREQKLEGEREWSEKQADEQQRKAEEAARIRAEEERRRTGEAEKDRKKAEAVFATLPDLVRQTAGKGLKAAVLVDSFVDETPDDEKPSRAIVIDRRTYYLKGWQIPFFEMCKESGVPLTIVTERVDVGLKRILHRSYHVLAIDLEHL